MEVNISRLRKPFRKPGEVLLKATLKDYKKARLLGSKIQTYEGWL